MWNTPTYNTKVTLELRDIVDNGVHSIDIWDFDYPSYYKGEEKKAFEKKVIDHYYFRQIGQETPARFIHYFQSRIREIMPYYIRMYESVKIMDELEDPFGNVDMVETFEQETTGTASGESSGSSTGSDTSSNNESRTSTEDKEHRFSNTPQGSISNLDKYMTEAFVDDNESTDTLNGSSTGTSEVNSSATSSSNNSESIRNTLTRKGNQGVNTYAHDMLEFRQAIIDVDMMIINNLQDLFLGVY